MHDESLVRYLELRKTPLHSAGGGLLKCCCPLHSERTPSFYLYPDGHGHCYGSCDSSFRDAVDLIRELEFGYMADPKERWRASFARARDLGLVEERPGYTPTVRRIEHRAPEPTAEQRQALTLACNTWHEYLLVTRPGHAAQRWLRTQRGLDGPCLPRIWEVLGVAPSDVKYHAELVRRFKLVFGDGWQDLALATGVLSASGTQRNRARLIFSCFNARGEVVFYQGRDLTGLSTAKFLNVPGLRKARFRGLAETDALYAGTCIDEGPLDVLAHNVCGFYGEANLGAKIPTTPQLRLMPSPILCFLDNEGLDAAGKPKAGLKGNQDLLARCQEAGIPASWPAQPAGIKDPSEWLARVGPAAFIADHERIIAHAHHAQADAARGDAAAIS